MEIRARVVTFTSLLVTELITLFTELNALFTELITLFTVKRARFRICDESSWQLHDEMAALSDVASLPQQLNPAENDLKPDHVSTWDLKPALDSASRKVYKRRRTISQMLCNDNGASTGTAPQYGDRFELDETLNTANLSSLQSNGQHSNSLTGGWITSLPSELQQLILAKLPYKDLFRSRAVCHDFNKLTKTDSFRRLQGECRSEEAHLTALHFNLKNGVWDCAGFDVVANMWRKLPPLTYLPQPDPALFKEYHVSASHGLMCMNVSKCSTRERLIVFNPLTRETRELPPMKHRRSPVLVHLHFCLVSRSFKVVVVGSSNDALLSRLTEVFESVTGEWTTSDDVPGVEFALNEYQSGVCVNGVIYCIAFLEGGQGKGLLGYDLVEGKWLVDLSCPLPVSVGDTSLQLVENNKKVYLYSEIEIGRNVLERRIHELEVNENGSRNGYMYEWRAVVKHEQSGMCGLEVYPENQCVAYGEGKICVYNTIQCTGLVYDVGDGCIVENLVAPPTEFGGEYFCSLNPMSFMFNPNYKSIV